MPRVLLLFVDGVGLGDDAAWNPFLSASLPNLAELLDGTLPVIGSTAPYHGSARQPRRHRCGTRRERHAAERHRPGHAADGRKRVVMHGRHFGPWVPAGLQQRVREESMLARRIGRRPERSLRKRLSRGSTGTRRRRQGSRCHAGEREAAPQGRSRVRRRAPAFLRAGPPLAALGAGVLDRHTAELARRRRCQRDHERGLARGFGRTHLPVIDAPTPVTTSHGSPRPTTSRSSRTTPPTTRAIAGSWTTLDRRSSGWTRSLAVSSRT
jgi:hypothetical protein